jgi:hypothetical protein
MSALSLLAEVKQGFRGLSPSPQTAARLVLTCTQLSACLSSLGHAEVHASKLRK